MIDNRELGQRIAELRNKAGLTQDELADELCISQSKLSRVEQGARADAC